MGHGENSAALERRVEDALGERMPQVDLLEFTVDGEMFRLVVDHPDGVDHDVCAAVTRALDDAGLLEDHGAEVWSPGPEPPMRRPEHFRRAVGARVKIRTGTGPDRASHVGLLEDAGETEVRVRTDAGVQTIAYGDIRRARRLADPSE
ncbi:MAG TPA: hypothetical protein PKE32_09615 [Miltoncostaeaceae bacterium]|nr:hypothetical protein [Miltoncostaeaceae bacterium]